MKKVFSIKVIVEIALYASIAFAIDLLAGGLSRFLFINGGSLSIAMLPIIVLTYRRGFIPGLICGFIVSIMQMLGGVYAVAGSWYHVLLQILLDYLLTYPVVALCAIFVKAFYSTEKQNKKYLFLILGVVVAGTAKFLCHFLAGVIFWSESIAWKSFEGLPVLYSLVYNGAYCLPNIILCAILLVLIYKLQPQLIEQDIDFIGGEEDE